MVRHSSLCLAVLAATLWFPTSPATADVIVIDNTTIGTVYDGILDGFPFPPPGMPKDGTPDFAGNALAVALQTGVTEERGVAELPLTSLAGLTAADIQSATLTFNIDDVVGTFGPGTTFDGTAGATIVLFGYSGNGTVDLADFNNVVGAPLSVVDTTPLGVITDSTLAVSGPLVFDINVTAALETLIGGGATHFGIVFTTNDAGSATSIDNMGPSGAGPAGVGGAAMPFLTVVTGAGDPPVFTPAALTCQKGIAKASQKFISAKQKALGKCFGSVLADAVTAEGSTKSTGKCASGLDVGDPKSKLSKAIAKFQATITDSCPAVLPAQINSPCNPAALDMAAIASCLLAHHGAQVEAALAAEYGDACALITAVGLDAALPGLCAAP